jgi:hypothetical protein
VFQIKDPGKMQDLDILKAVLPPRKDWQRPKFHKNRLKFSSSISLNKNAIINKVFHIRRLVNDGRLKADEIPVWYHKLEAFIRILIERVIDPDKFSLDRPMIYPAKKNYLDKKSIERRPITKFKLMDCIILSLTNRYYTALFDTEFMDCSFAFRSFNTNKRTPTYHDAVYLIKEFRKKNLEVPLFVAECDIKKFFDCVDHETVKRKYHEFCKVLQHKGINIDPLAEKILYSYLACYSFNQDVYPNNDNETYWRKFNDRGRFTWVDDCIERVSAFPSETIRIGIPQGGALSGLIVNLIMHDVDKLLMGNGYGTDYLYLRYCDDMIIIHKSSTECQLLFEKYSNGLDLIKLNYHLPAQLRPCYSKHFWSDDVKTRNLFSWSNKRHDTFPHSPWVSFLGYMIYTNGDLKIRKKSIEKQHLKHEEEAKKVLAVLEAHTNEDLRRNKNEIVRSFESRLFSMAVGKVDIGKYKSLPVHMCWGSGFRLIEDNKFIRAQLKKLDRSRKEQVLVVKRYIYQRLREHDGPSRKQSKKIFDIQYPHSFYSLLNRNKNLPTNSL